MLTYEYVQKMAIKKVEEKTSDGKTVTKEVPITYNEAHPVMIPLSESEVLIKDLEGKSVTYAEAAKKVTGGAIALRRYTWKGPKLDAAFAKAMKEGTLVFEIQAMAPPSKDATGKPPLAKP